MFTAKTPQRTLLAIAFLAGVACFAEAQVTIDGFVFDSARKPVAGVDVTIWVAGKPKPLATAKSGKDGKYQLADVKTDTEFDIAYGATEYDAAFVHQLAETKPQQISKVLYKKKQTRSLAAMHEYFDNIERSLVLLASVEAFDRKPLMESLAAAQIQIKDKPDLELYASDLGSGAREFLQAKARCVRTAWDMIAGSR